MIQTALHLLLWLNYADGEKRYIIAPQGLQVGASIMSGDAVAPEIGNALMLKNMPLGTVVIILKCSLARVVNWQEAQVHLHSLLIKKKNMLY